MFSGMRPENRGESGILDAARLRQQRRLKQAVQFLHKDSADLLPLDGLKKLGTSKQGQPHHILQKRLLEAKLSSRGRMGVCGLSPGNNNFLQLKRNHSKSLDKDDPDEDDFIYVACKCLGQEVHVLIDTGCKMNLMSSATVDRLGVKGLMEENKLETDAFPFQRKLHMDASIQELSITIGQMKINCSFAVVESNKPLMCLGSKTLKSHKCVIDTEGQTFTFGRTTREQVHFVKKTERNV
ncbi:nuclear receptor-interacting protein 3-like [Dunckerocampus dactyliophorus]|uniref:nuclear receptor-interacting protein 3-like n=1 Tax=Dunckerocampus dactyliophorus TaxID=161453 RepID=UPI002405F89E|nr:nuclear receptor-interacting protein 3-like [Dunckerocampus dactyliophorus]